MAHENLKDGLTREGVQLPFVPVGTHTQTNSLSTAADITVPSGATQWLMQAQTKGVRFILDETTTATTTKGFLLTTDAAPLLVPVRPGQVISVIQVEATAVFDYQFGA